MQSRATVLPLKSFLKERNPSCRFLYDIRWLASEYRGEVRAGNVPGGGVIITDPLGNDEVPESKHHQTENKPVWA